MSTRYVVHYPNAFPDEFRVYSYDTSIPEEFEYVEQAWEYYEDLSAADAQKRFGGPPGTTEGIYFIGHRSVCRVEDILDELNYYAAAYG